MKFRTLTELGHATQDAQLLEDNREAYLAGHAHLKNTDIVLIPQPSRDINDPLRWSKSRKWFAFLNVCLLAFMTAGFTSGFSPVLYPLSLEFRVDLTTATGQITWPLLVNGLGNFIWVPTAQYFGRRPVFVISSLLTFVAIIWAAVAQTFGSLLGARIVAAFAGSSTEALAAAMINDIFFLHERGSKMGVYVVIFGAGNSLPPLVAGFMTGSVGWRWFAWLAAIIAGLNFVAIFFLVPESRFNRTPEEVTVPAPTDAVVDEDKTVPSEKVEQIPQTQPQEQIFGTKKTFVQELSLWSGVTKESYLSHFMRPFLLVLYPAVAWALFAYSLHLAWLLGSASLSSFIFQAPPYNFSPGVNGLINIPALLGNFFGGFTGGYLTDVYARYVARRKGGRFIAESRLVVLLIPGLTVAAGLLMFGIGADKKLHWIVLYIGYAFQSAAVGVSGIGMTYVLDNYFEVAPEALLMVNGTKNVVAWGFLRGFIPWTTRSGYGVVFGAMTGIWLGLLLLAVPLYFFGARMRTYTAQKFRIIFW